MKASAMRSPWMVQLAIGAAIGLTVVVTVFLLID